MKIIVKMFKVAALVALILFSMAACDTGVEDIENNNGPTHFDGSFKISTQQVWEGTNSNKISEVYKKFEGERGISIKAYWPDGNGKFNPTKSLGRGEIGKGLLNCEVPEPDAGNLMEWKDFKFEFSAWDNLACIPETTKGTYLRLVTSEDEWLNREKMSGSRDSLWLESIWFIYIDRDCKITGTPSEGIRPGDAFYETVENLDLVFKKGWNTICRKQLLTGERGIETDSIKLKNPNDFRWAIRLVHP
jgi:hypothetical protein